MITAQGLALKGPRGAVFGPLDLELPAGGFSLLVGEHGSGRTCALLCLVGRMKPSSGTLEVLGHALPKRASRVQQASALACSPGLDDLDEALTVRELFAERLHLRLPAHRRGPLDADRIAEFCARTFGSNELPEARTRVWDLDRPRRVALQLALALVADPQLLAVDDLDQLSVPDRVELFGTLQELADSGITVVAATTPDVLPDSDRPRVVEIHGGSLPGGDSAGASPAAAEPSPRHAAADTSPQARRTASATGKES